MFKRKQSHTFLNFFKKFFFSEFINKENDKITGNVVKFDKRKGYGFIKPNDGGPDVFVHYSDICHNRSYAITSKEKNKLTWNSNMNLRNNKDDLNFENDYKKEQEIKKEFKYLIPGERVKFSVIYDEKSHSSKAINVEYLD
ncbi:cold-shock protein, putative [Plasmodium gallinaceum]|uniref:Cold-shock protein, putative n=1 Tax=Plasmodium gallinaceum TaxID=5849 RepID=A0A1J1GM83_PLAGA|nr:cold-shock protein, putative [Plasmodium gallinaceum]CRG93349.1 cold-shock protein, putative [Plasmodium gallinaceum]